LNYVFQKASALEACDWNNDAIRKPTKKSMQLFSVFNKRATRPFPVICPQVALHQNIQIDVIFLRVWNHETATARNEFPRVQRNYGINL
jgi:hypothetical protein